MTQKPRACNQSCLLLQRDENDTLFQLAGPKCVVLASGVAQIFLAEEPSYSHWSKKYVGIVTFIKDNERRGYFIRLFDIEARVLLWEQEIYNFFDYQILRPFFHSFETDDCPAGLNFANDQEACGFMRVVQEYLNKREKRRHDRTLHHSSNTSPPQCHPAPYIVKPMMMNKPITPVSKSNGESKKKPNSKKNKKGKIDKRDIGNPSNFQHVNHVGWDANKGLDLNNLDPGLRQLFNQVGLTDENLKDENTANFVYSFIEQHGGLEAVKKRPSLPSVPPVRPSISNVPPPPPPPINQVPSRPKPPVPPPGPPPGPPPSIPPLPPQRILPQPTSNASHAPTGVPPPPPPPPPIHISSLPQSKPSALMDEIHKGRELHHVDVEDSSSQNDGRDALLANIRGGIQLRTVNKSEQSPKEEVGTQEDSLAGALMRALNNRAMALRSDDDEGDNEDEDDEEWDD